MNVGLDVFLEQYLEPLSWIIAVLFIFAFSRAVFRLGRRLYFNLKKGRYD